MQLTVSMGLNGQTEQPLEVDAGCTINDVKAAIQASLGYRPELQNLVFGATVLDEGTSTLDAFGVNDGARLLLIIKGGGIAGMWKWTESGMAAFRVVVELSLGFKAKVDTQIEYVQDREGNGRILSGTYRLKPDNTIEIEVAYESVQIAFSASLDGDSMTLIDSKLVNRADLAQCYVPVPREPEDKGDAVVLKKYPAKTHWEGTYAFQERRTSPVELSLYPNCCVWKEKAAKKEYKGNWEIEETTGEVVFEVKDDSGRQISCRIQKECDDLTLVDKKLKELTGHGFTLVDREPEDEDPLTVLSNWYASANVPWTKRSSDSTVPS